MSSVSIHREIWNECFNRLSKQYEKRIFNLWIRPLQVKLYSGKALILLAPNEYIIEELTKQFLPKIKEIVADLNKDMEVFIELGSEIDDGGGNHLAEKKENRLVDNSVDNLELSLHSSLGKDQFQIGSKLIAEYNFENFIQGKSNQFAYAAALQVAENLAGSNNPLLLYGDVGIGKTMLTHAIGNRVKQEKPDIKVVYIHAERFVTNMVKSIQTNCIEHFKSFYCSVDVLLLDDVQFFAGKKYTQEIFFHIFNTLLEEHKQIILISDRYPREIKGLTERLQSRFGWGLVIAIEPPELETRVAILISKAKKFNVELPYEVAFFIAQKVRSNVRELEGALKRVIANAHFSKDKITVGFTRGILKDLIIIQDRLITIDNIQRTVAEYYRVKLSDLLSKKRTKSITRARQMAMLLTRELTENSLPEIGKTFGGRDHTTVLHACNRIRELINLNADIQEDYRNLTKILSN